MDVKLQLRLDLIIYNALLKVQSPSHLIYENISYQPLASLASGKSEGTTLLSILPLKNPITK